MSHLFVSYAAPDQNFAIHLFRWLAEAGIQAVVDSQTARKSTNGHGVNHSIEEAFAVVVVMTSEARATEYVTYEWAYALGMKKPVIPLLLEPIPLHPGLQGLSVLNFSTDQPAWGDLIQRLRKAQAAHHANRMIDGLQNPHWETRMVAAEILGRRGDPAVIPLLGAALFDPVLEVRSAAAQALGALGDAGSVPYLQQALADTEPEVQIECVRALGKIGAESSVRSLIECLRDTHTRIRWNAAWALGEMGMVALPGLVAAIGDPDNRVRGTAVGALAALGVSESVPELVQALADENWTVREAAARALGQMEDAAAVHGLIAALYDSDDRVRGTASSALAAIGLPAIQALGNLLDEPNATVRLAAVGAFGVMSHKVKTPILFQALAYALQDEAPSVRATAVWALGQLGDKATRLLAEALLWDTDETVRSAALKVLLRMDSPAARAAIQAWKKKV